MDAISVRQEICFARKKAAPDTLNAPTGAKLRAAAARVTPTPAHDPKPKFPWFLFAPAAGGSPSPARK